MAWPASAILELEVGYLVNLQQCLLVTHWMATDSGDGRTELEICKSIVDTQSTGGNGTLVGELRNVLATNATIYFVSAQEVHPVRRRRIKAAINFAGLKAGTAQAQNVQASIEKATDLSGRSQIGGMRIGAVPVADLSAGLLAPAYMTALNTFANWYLNDSSALDPSLFLSWFPVILNREPIPATDPVKYRIKGGSRVSNVTTFNTIRTMSRRTVGRGD